MRSFEDHVEGMVFEAQVAGILELQELFLAFQRLFPGLHKEHLHSIERGLAWGAVNIMSHWATTRLEQGS